MLRDRFRPKFGHASRRPAAYFGQMRSWTAPLGALAVFAASQFTGAPCFSASTSVHPDGSVEEDGQWTMPAKNFQGTRYSGLNEINTENAKNLKVAWTFSTGVNRGQEAAPIVVGDTMYVVTPYPNILYALDLKNDGAVRWSYKPQPSAAAQGVACCDTVNRGCVFDRGKIYFNT